MLMGGIFDGLGNAFKSARVLHRFLLSGCSLVRAFLRMIPEELLLAVSFSDSIKRLLLSCFAYIMKLLASS